MSPHVNNFVTDLVLMAKAMEELPQVQHQLKDTQEALDQSRWDVQDRELRILNLKTEVETHLASIRSLEVARDDAELRFLELEEKVHLAIDTLGMCQTALGNTLIDLSPPKPEPVSTIQPAEAVGDQDMGHGSSSDQGPSADPLSQSENWTGTSSASVQEETAGTHTASLSDTAHNPSPGQSEADPTATTSQTEQATAHLPIAEAQGNASEVPSVGKYSGKLYEDHPYYVSLAAWIAGGGTEQDYHSRKPVDKFGSF